MKIMQINPLSWLELSILLRERKGKKLFIEGLSREPLEPGTIITRAGQGLGILQVIEEVDRRDAKGNFTPPETAISLWFRAEVKSISVLQAHKLAPDQFTKPAPDKKEKGKRGVTKP